MLDPDALLQVLIDAGHPLTEARYVAGQILALVRPAAIDRDALMDLLIRYDVEHPATLGEAADVRAIYVNRILALVRPVAGGAAS